MKTVFSLPLILVVMLFVVTTTMAQEATAEATATPAPIVTTSPAVPPTQDATSLLFSLIEKAGYIVAFFLLYKSVPIGALKDVLKTAETAAASTSTPVDDMAVQLGAIIVDALNKQAAEKAG